MTQLERLNKTSKVVGNDKRGKPPQQVGITYFVGNFENGNELIFSRYDAVVGPDASLLEKTKNLLERIKRQLKGSRPREIWCSEMLSLPVSKITNLVNSPATPVR